MALNVGELEATLRLRDELSGQLRTVEARLAKTGQGFDDVATRAGNFGMGTEKVTTALTKLGAAFGIAFGLRTITNAISGVIQLGDEIDTMSQSVGVGVVEFQKLAAVAEDNNIEMQVFANALGTMNKRLAGGDDSTVAGVRKLGLELTDLTAQSPDEAFLRIAEAIDKIDDPMERAERAAQIFGARLGKQLIPMFKETRAEAAKTATAFDQEMIIKLAAFDKQINAAKRSWMGFLAEFTGPLLDAAIEGMTRLSETKDKLQKRDPVNIPEVFPGLTMLHDFIGAYDKLKGGVNAVRDAWNVAIDKMRGISPIGQLINEQTRAAKENADAVTNMADAHVKAWQRSREQVEAAQRTLEQYRRDAAFPLTEEHKRLIVEMDKIGQSAKEIATAFNLPTVAVELYLKSLGEAASRQKEFAAGTVEIAGIFTDMRNRQLKETEQFYTDQVALMQKGNQRMVDALMNEPLFKGAGSTDAGQGVGLLEFNIANALDPLPVTEMDKAFEALNAEIERINLDPLGAKIERQTVAWAKVQPGALADPERARGRGRGHGRRRLAASRRATDDPATGRRRRWLSIAHARVRDRRHRHQAHDGDGGRSRAGGDHSAREDGRDKYQRVREREQQLYPDR